VLEEVVDGNGGSEKLCFSDRVFLVIIFYKPSEGGRIFAIKNSEC
jgi:hypothetical protein